MAYRSAWIAGTVLLFTTGATECGPCGMGAGRYSVDVCTVSPGYWTSCSDPNWGTVTPYLGPDAFNSVAVAMAVGSPRPDSRMVEIYDETGTTRLDVAATYLSSADLEFGCHSALLLFDLSARPETRVLVVSYLDRAPEGLTRYFDPREVEDFHGERALVTLLELRDPTPPDAPPP